MRGKPVAVALVVALLLPGCTNSAGSIDWLRTTGLAVGVLAVGGLVYSATQARDRRDDADEYCRRNYGGAQQRACIERARRR
ncbi:MAG: hypothetical protein HY059_10960 [Proteobacteria bacterium]|nr:hypothetical protein [Pseudomonadota bacterium]